MLMLGREVGREGEREREEVEGAEAIGSVV